MQLKTKTLPVLLLKQLGLRGTAAYVFKERLLRLLPSLIKPNGAFTYKLYVRNIKYPLYCRYNTSDREVFAQIFIREQYGGVEVNPSPRLIVDCGANAGFSTAYFLARFPSARVVAIEPDRENFEVLKLNLAPYSNRAYWLNMALWSHKTGLVVNKAVYGERREWSITVREVRQGETADVEAIDMESLLDQLGEDKIDICKIDIEGAEAVVFAGDRTSWIKKVHSFLIELHNDECRNIFMKALQHDDFEFSRYGDITRAIRVSSSSDQQGLP